MKNLTRFLLLLGVVLLFVGCGGETSVETPTATAVVELPPTAPPTAAPEPTPTPSPLAQGTGGFPWWNDTVFYQVFVRSFYDSDGDGIGDLNGLIEKLDYLNDGDPETNTDLGVTGIWLMPIMDGPRQHPHGYHITDYYRVHPDYGANDDFRRLVEEAHKRGIRVIVDLVLNHTAQEHPWFQEARDPHSPRRDWYIWADENPGYRGPDGQQVWHRAGDSYYYAVFNGLIPDLNLENPEVTEELYNITRFWLEEMNVDGFRLDAIKHLVEDGQRQENTPATHAWLQDYYTFYKSVDPHAFAVGEAWTAEFEMARYTGDKVDIVFMFDLATGFINAARNRAARPVATAMTRVVNNFPPGQYATFLANHDQNRTLSQLDDIESKAYLAASLLLTAPGVPFVYYGEEIGMKGVANPRAAITEEDMRRPMLWRSDSIGVGFTTGVPWRAPSADYQERSVALQDDDPASLLNHYRALIHLRNRREALRVGEWTPVSAGHAQIYAFLRHTENEVILVLVNLSLEPITAAQYSLQLDEGPLAGPVTPRLLFGAGNPVPPEVNAAGGFDAYTPFETLPPESTLILIMENE